MSSDVAEHHILRPGRTTAPDDGEILDLLRRRIDPGQFERLQRSHAALVEQDHRYAKYLDVDRYLMKNIRIARRLGLLAGGPARRILDLGSGCGFFPHVCRAFGHETFCIDRPGTALFDDFMKLFGLDRLDRTIIPFVALDLPWNRFDLVTGLMVSFDRIGHADRYGPEQWRFLLADIAANILAPGGRVYLLLNEEPRREEVTSANVAAFRRWGATVGGPGSTEVDFPGLGGVAADPTGT